MPVIRKDGTKNYHLIGLKLEEKGTIPLIRNKSLLTDLLEQIGEIQIVNTESGIYRVEIGGVGLRGATKRIYNNIKKKLNRFSVYRTYNYEEASKSAVFLEPIVISDELREILRAKGLEDFVPTAKDIAERKAAEVKRTLTKVNQLRDKVLEQL